MRPKENSEHDKKELKELLSVRIGQQTFGIPVLLIHEVLEDRKTTRVPLAPTEIMGTMNLRGRIVTAIDMRKTLHMEPQSEDIRNMHVVVEHAGESYSLVVDSVSEVLSLSEDMFEKTPSTINPLWRDLTTGVYRLDGDILVALNVSSILGSLCNRDTATKQ